MRALTIVLQAFDITVYDISWAGLAFLNIYDEEKTLFIWTGLLLLFFFLHGHFEKYAWM